MESLPASAFVQLAIKVGIPFPRKIDTIWLCEESAYNGPNFHYRERYAQPPNHRGEPYVVQGVALKTNREPLHYPHAGISYHS